MKAPSGMFPASSGARDDPFLNSPTSFVSPPANANICGNGKYSPKGTRWTLSYRAVQSPEGLTSAAELKTSKVGEPFSTALELPIEPVTTQLRVVRAISLTGPRNSGSVVKKGAGDAGHTIKSGLMGAAPRTPDNTEFDIPALTLRSVSSPSVRSKLSRVQFSSTGIFSCTRSAA